MDDLETMLTLKFSLQKEQNCYSSLSTQVRSWIRSLFLHSIHACLLERKFNYVHISLFQAGIGKHFHVLFLFYLFLIVSFSICLIIGIRIQKQLSNVSRFLGSRIWTTRTDHHRWRLEPSKWKDEQGALSLNSEDEFKCICFLYCDCQTWSRSYSTSIVLEEASLEKKTLCEPNRPWCSLSAWGNYSRVVDPGILVRFKLLLFNCEHMSCGWAERILALMQVQLKRSLCLKVCHIPFQPNMGYLNAKSSWLTEYKNCEKKRTRLLLKWHEKKIQYFVWKNNSCLVRLTCCAEVFSSRP